MALTDLPYTIFADIIARVSPREAIAARRTSRAVRAALTRPELCISLLLLHFPRARESRELRTLLLRRSDAATAQLESVGWAVALAATARRYHHLGAATARATHTLAAAPTPADAAAMLRGVEPWRRYLRLDDKTAAFHHGDPAWTCDADAGLLVRPVVAGRRYVLQDVEDEDGGGRTWPVPFETGGKLVRRVRLSRGVLIFEWCEDKQREEDGAHRHFATAYDVRRVRRDGCEAGDDFYTLRRYAKDGGNAEKAMRATACSVAFRAEWKIHSLGIAPHRQDRFFSTHNSTHYAVYIWQPTRPGEHEPAPLERLIIWDIRRSSSSPRIIAQLTCAQLDHWGVRQRDTPSLRCLRLDDCTRDPFSGGDDDDDDPCGHVFFVEEEHRWAAGPHSSPAPPRLHHVKTTGIPLGGSPGPRWVDECGRIPRQPGSSSSQMPFCGRDDARTTKDTVATAAVEMDSTWPGRCPCWRHDDFPYLTVCEVRDAAAGVRFSARRCFMLETLSVHVKPRLRVHGVVATRRRRRPPPPTARDAPSSSRRHSVHGTDTSPASSADVSSQSGEIAKGGGGDVGPVGEKRLRRGYSNYGIVKEEESSVVSGSDVGSRRSATANRDIQFADDAWTKLLGVGHICGNERWLLGQDSDGAITVMYF